MIEQSNASFFRKGGCKRKLTGPLTLFEVARVGRSLDRGADLSERTAFGDEIVEFRGGLDLGEKAALIARGFVSSNFSTNFSTLPHNSTLPRHSFRGRIMHPRQRILRRELAREQLLHRSLERAEPRTQLATIDPRHLLSESLNKTFFERKVSRLRLRHTFLQTRRKLRLIRRTIKCRIQQRPTHSLIGHARKDIVTDLMNCRVRRGHERIDANDTVAILVHEIHPANFLTAFSKCTIKLDLQAPASRDLGRKVDILLCDSILASAFWTLQASIDFTSGVGCIYFSRLISRLNITKWSLLRNTALSLQLAKSFLIRSFFRRGKLTRPTTLEHLKHILKRLICTLCDKSLHLTGITQDLSDLRIVREFFELLAGQLHLDFLSGALEQINRRLSLRLPPVGVVFRHSLFRHSFAFGRKELLAALKLAPNSQAFLARRRKLTRRISHELSPFTRGSKFRTLNRPTLRQILKACRPTKCRGPIEQSPQRDISRKARPRELSALRHVNKLSGR